MIIFKVKSSAKEISHFDARIRNSHSLEIKLTKVGFERVKVGWRKKQGPEEEEGNRQGEVKKMADVCPVLGGDADLRGLPDRVDPLRSGVRGIGFRRARLCAHSGLRHSHAAGQVLRHVQPHHLPGGGPEDVLHEFLLL